MFRVETLRGTIDFGYLEKFNSFLEVFFEVSLLNRLLFFFGGGERTGSFLELQKPLIILAYLFSHDYLLALRFFLNLCQDLLPWVDEDLLKVLHITFLSLHGPWLEFRRFFLFQGIQLRPILLGGVQGR